MANKNYEMYQNMDDTELQDNLQGAKTELAKLKFDHATRGLENPLRIREVRRDVSRILTEINARSKKEKQA